MNDVGAGAKADGSQLRERPSAKPVQLHNSHDAKQRVLEVNNQEYQAHKDEQTKRTYGRISDGTGKRLCCVVSRSNELLKPPHRL